MAASVRFEGVESPGERHSYSLRSLESQRNHCPKATVQSALKKKKVQRRKGVKRGVCGDLKVLSTRSSRQVTMRHSTIEQKEVSLPSILTSSPDKVVIKTNPLYSSSPPNNGNNGGRGMENTSQENGVVEGREVFYGQRRKIRKTKEQEMITAIIDLTNHSEKKRGPKRRKASLLQKIRSLGSKRGVSRISSKTRTNKNMYQMLTQI